MGVYKFTYNDGSVSNHDTLEGMVEMLIHELDEGDFETQYTSYKIGWSEEEKIDFITMFDVEVNKL